MHSIQCTRSRGKNSLSPSSVYLFPKASGNVIFFINPTRQTFEFLSERFNYRSLLRVSSLNFNVLLNFDVSFRVRFKYGSSLRGILVIIS